MIYKTELFHQRAQCLLVTQEDLAQKNQSSESAQGLQHKCIKNSFPRSRSLVETPNKSLLATTMSESSETSDSGRTGSSFRTEDHRKTKDDHESDNEAEKLLAQSETRYVLRLRILVFLALLLAALAVSLTVYFVTANSEQEQFMVGFEGNAQKLMDSFDEIVNVRIGAIANLAVTFTEFARDRNVTWPYVTMTDFHQRAGSAREISNTLFVHMYPIVTNETRAGWEEYSVREKGWLDQGRAYQAANNLGFERRQLAESDTPVEVEKVQYTGANSTTGPSLIATRIWSLGPTGPFVDNTPGPYFPAWQESPVVPFPADYVNLNMLALEKFRSNMVDSVASEKVVISGFRTYPPGTMGNPDGGTNFFASLLSFEAGKSVMYIGDPLTTFCIPIFDSFQAGKKVVAVLFSAFHWSSYFERILPPNSQAMTVVIDNTCNGTFTYSVKGSNVEYTGEGDLHEPRMSGYVTTTSFNVSAPVKSNAGIDYQINQDGCVFKLSVYPTVEMYNFYNTDIPIVITVVIVFIFVFTAVMFFVYDRLVERRQRIVMKTAVKSSQIVSSLFPKQIRDRLFAEEGQDGPVHGTKTKLKSFLAGSGDPTDNDRLSFDAKPIADLCT